MRIRAGKAYEAEVIEVLLLLLSGEYRVPPRKLPEDAQDYGIMLLELRIVCDHVGVVILNEVAGD